MVNGIASLRRYQEGGEIPDVYANILAAIRSGVSQQALPDSLKGRERAQMMRDLDRFGADTAQINQKGIYNFFRDELPELLELVSQISEHDQPLTIEPYSSRDFTGGQYIQQGFYDQSAEGGNKIRLNLLPSIASNARLEILPGFSQALTQEGWEKSPAEVVRENLFHELGHASDPHLYENLADARESDLLNATEPYADNFAAILKAIRDASPEDTRRDVLDEAQRLYWTSGNTYKYRPGMRYAKEQPGWAGWPEDFTGVGSPDDPWVINPSYMEEVERSQRDQMRPILDQILDARMYEGHSLNEPVAAEGLRGGWHRGIQSLRSGLSNLWDRVRS